MHGRNDQEETRLYPFVEPDKLRAALDCALADPKGCVTAHFHPLPGGVQDVEIRFILNPKIKGGET